MNDRLADEHVGEDIRAECAGEELAFVAADCPARLRRKPERSTSAAKQSILQHVRLGALACSAFGDTSIAATATNPDHLSAFAALLGGGTPAAASKRRAADTSSSDGIRTAISSSSMDAAISTLSWRNIFCGK